MIVRAKAALKEIRALIKQSVSDEEVRRRMHMHEANADPNVLITFDELVAGLRGQRTIG